MSENEILSLSKEELSRMFASGEARLVKPAPQHEKPKGEVARIDEAKKMLGKDFLAGDTYKELTDKLQRVGVDVEFIFDNIDSFPYVKQDIELARTHGEMLIHRPKAMKIGKGRKQREVPITVLNLRELFSKDPNGKLSNMFYKYGPDWYKDEDFANKEAIAGGWTLVKKEPLPDSFGKNWQQQEDLSIENYAKELESDGASEYMVRRRTATEAAFDSMFYYTINGDRLLEDKLDWTSSQTSDGYRVVVGGFGAKGLSVRNDYPDHSLPNLGVVSQR